MTGSIDGAREGLSSVTRGTFVMLLGTFGFVAESFVGRVILIRILNNTFLWSQFSYALALAGLLTAVGTLGLTSALGRSLPFESGNPERRRMVYTALVVGVPAALVAGAVLSILSLPVSTTYHSPVFGLTLLFFGIAVTFAVLASLLASVFQGYEDVIPNALYIQVLNPLIFIVFLIVAAVATPGAGAYDGILVAYTLSNVASFVALVLYTRRKLPTLLPPGPRDPGVSRKLLLFSLPLFFVGVLSFVGGNGDTIILGLFARNSVGFYAADLSLARLLTIGVGSLGYIFLPVASRFVRLKDPVAARVTYVTATKWIALTALPIFLVFFFLPSESLSFVYGASYAGSGLPLEILVLGALVSTLVGPSTVAQVAYGHTRLLFYNTLIAAVADVVLAIALVPSYGLVGASIAWTAGTALYPILSLVEIAALERLHPFERHYWLPLLVTALPVGLLLYLLPFAPSLWLLPGIVIAAAIWFIAAVVFTGSIDDGDRLLLEAVESLLRRPLPFVRTLGSLSRRISGRAAR